MPYNKMHLFCDKKKPYYKRGKSKHMKRNSLCIALINTEKNKTG